jgi:hypothetical protein
MGSSLIDGGMSRRRLQIFVKCSSNLQQQISGRKDFRSVLTAGKFLKVAVDRVTGRPVFHEGSLEMQQWPKRGWFDVKNTGSVANRCAIMTSLKLPPSRTQYETWSGTIF